MQIKNVDNKVKEDVKIFLSNIDLVDSIEEEIINNGVALYIDDKISGYVTYEAFCEYGLIRYFVFQKTINIEIVRELFNELANKSCKNGIESLISIGKDEEVIELFLYLGFEKMDFENFIVNGTTLRGTELENANVLLYRHK